MAQTVRCRPLRGHRRRSIVKTRAGACAASARRDRRPCVISRHLLRLCPRLKGKPYAELRLPPRREVAWAPPPHIFCELPRRRRPGRDAPPASGGGSGCKAAAGAPVGRRSGCGGAHDAADADLFPAREEWENKKPTPAPRKYLFHEMSNCMVLNKASLCTGMPSNAQ
ncbi:unnamed protein product [Prorocentrum cordatum]|uniref:Uncharacterized protein n=1 Tax=Prorocentrum cordatum TaxID=2364126 RepID=A0ABN9SLZ2_9DINO|nr:unnamed protein product [Polarella glacialis]